MPSENTARLIVSYDCAKLMSNIIRLPNGETPYSVGKVCLLVRYTYKRSSVYHTRQSQVY